jgi:peptidoglycan/xylan/chitin deacetylase (PgdA/CDA1 family)
MPVRQIIIYHAKKHPSLATIMLLASVIVFAGICSYLVVGPSWHADAFASGKGTANPKDIITQFDSIEYPVLGVEKVDTLLKAYVTKQSNEFTVTLGGAARDSKNRIVIRYVLIHHGERTASVLFTKLEERVGHPEVASQNMLTFDLATGKQITLADLFKPEADLPLGLLLYDYLKQESPPGFSPADYANLVQFHTSSIQDFWLTSDSVVLALYVRQPHNEQNKTTIMIKKELLAGIVAESYAAPDPGDDRPVRLANFTITQRPTPVAKIDPTQKMLALTFDDGPKPSTNRVLDVLHKHRVHGTFFVLGQQAASYPGEVRRMVANGHEIGNHSWNHASLPSLTEGQLQQQISDTQRIIHSITGGYTPTQMRPPYGAISPGVTTFLASQGLKPALWNIDTEDWLLKDSQQVYDRIMNSAADGGIILVHDIYPSSVEAVERAVPELIAQGYQLVTLSQLEHYR